MRAQGADGEAQFRALRLPGCRQRARTAEESRGASVCGGGGRRWAAAAVAAAAVLLPVWELVGGGDCERAHQPEGALPRRRAAQARAAGARPPQGRGGQRGLRGRLLLRPPVGARERPSPRRPPASRLAPPFSHPSPRAGTPAASRTRVPWRTRIRGLFPPRLEPLLYRRVFLPQREAWLLPGVGQRLGAPLLDLLLPSFSPLVTKRDHVLS